MNTEITPKKCYIGQREQNGIDIAFLRGFYSTIEAAQRDINEDSTRGELRVFPNDAEIIVYDEENEY